ncbi:hypothetical protein [Cumulibacter manganitolerans]|uniref:hypothetical protein n=1 Tax=Cumulibacter manganitolerans TaxID=1884992 RepID=UPI001886340C|nr:hypothetical protein [Cumulibacter manganitolerans]
MDISNYLGKVREGFDAATSLADDRTQDVASRVASTVEPSVRLALIEAISDATNEINDELATADVSMTLVAGNPEFVIDEHGISVAQLASYDETDDDSSAEPEGEGEPEPEAGDEDDDESLVRFSLRLPKWAKDKVDRRAEKEGMSTNAYLTELIVSQVARRRGPRGGGPGFGPGPQGGSGFGRGYGPRRGGPGFGPGRPGFGPRGDFGPGVDPEMLRQLGRMLARGLGEPGGPRGRRRPDGRGHEGGHGHGPDCHGHRHHHGGERGSRGPADPRDDG